MTDSRQRHTAPPLPPLAAAPGPPGLVPAGPIEQLLEAAAATTRPREVLRAAAGLLGTCLGGRGSCVLVSESGARVVIASDGREQDDFRLDLARYPEIRGALAARSAIFIDDVQTDPRLEEVRELLPAQLGAVAAVPLVAGLHCLGVLLVQSALPWQHPHETRRLAALLAVTAALIFEARSGRSITDSLVPHPGAERRGAEAASLPRHLTPVRGIDISAVPRRRVLIAEDDIEQREVLALALADEGFDVQVAADGAAALACARKWRPDLVLLDVCMPVMDGFSTAEELVKDPRTAHVPLLFLSAADDLLPRLRGLSLAEMDFMRKPYELTELFTRMERSLHEARANAHLRRKANMDELTGVGNFRYLREQLAIEKSRVERYGTELALVVADVDRLKQTNDRFGHVVGSRVLRAIGEAVRGAIRDTDLAARYGGDEFVIALSHSGRAEGLAFAHRLLDRVRSIDVDGARTSVSLGVAAFGPTHAVSFEQMLAHADAAAYRAKRLGGDRVCAYERALDAEHAEAAVSRAPAAG